MFESEYEQDYIMHGEGQEAWNWLGAEKEIMGAGKAKVVQIGNAMEGVHFVKD